MIDELALQVINEYGLRNQLKHLSGEYYELVESILMDDSDENIAEEIADMMTILKTIQLKFGINDLYIRKIMVDKLMRERDRINENH